MQLFQISRHTKQCNSAGETEGVHGPWGDDSQGISHFHLHLLFGRAVSMPDHSYDTAQLHPVVGGGGGGGGGGEGREWGEELLFMVQARWFAASTGMSHVEN